MSELRKDPVVGRWVIIASERANRPSDFSKSRVPENPGNHCPFCPGQEKGTPPEIMAVRSFGSKRDGGGWSVRVVPNKFPALDLSGEMDRLGVGLYDQMSGIGAHEVIIESPHHQDTFAKMSEDQLGKVLTMYQRRIDQLEKDPRLKYIMVFKNYGEAAGASLAHPHTQIIATPITPRNVKLKLEGAQSYFLQKERCVFCDMMRQELFSGERLVFQNDHFVVYTPFASRFPFEVIIFPRRHECDYKQITGEGLKSLASVLKDLFGRLQTVLDNPPFNLILYTAPNQVPRAGRPQYWGTILQDFHWHMEIIPRLTKVAGFEWGTGFYINTVSPEQAAQLLREPT